MLYSFEAITGVDAADTDVSAVYRRVLTRLPAKGTLDEMSSPMLLATTELAGAFCKAMVRQQSQLPSGLRLYFNNVDFKKDKRQFTPALIETTIRELTQGFWQREPTPEEWNLLNEMAKETLAAAGTGILETQNILAVHCLQLATSIGFLIY